MEHFSYRKLRAYDHAKKLVVIVYDILKQFPREENYVLCDQLRRAVISIPSNIAEGSRRDGKKFYQRTNPFYRNCFWFTK